MKKNQLLHWGGAAKVFIISPYFVGHFRDVYIIFLQIYKIKMRNYNKVDKKNTALFHNRTASRFNKLIFHHHFQNRRKGTLYFFPPK